jgi:hypothetical protein
MKLAGSINTPWGRSDSITKASDGVFWVTTPSHGGVHLSAEVNAEIPEYMRSTDGWYEEDCQWCLPVVALGAARIAPDHPKGLADIEDIANKLMRALYRKAWDRFTSRALEPRKDWSEVERIIRRIDRQKEAESDPKVYHSHPPQYGRLEPGCLRCLELSGGARARVGRGWRD